MPSPNQGGGVGEFSIQDKEEIKIKISRIKTIMEEQKKTINNNEKVIRVNNVVNNVDNKR